MNPAYTVSIPIPLNFLSENKNLLPTEVYQAMLTDKQTQPSNKDHLQQLPSSTKMQLFQSH